MASLRHGLIYRLGADAGVLALGLFAGVLTARWLGPDGKGVLAALSLLVAVFIQAACLGQGEAAVYLVGQRRFSSQAALSATVGVVILTTALAVLLFLGASAAQFSGAWQSIWIPVLLAGLWLAAAAFSNVLMWFLHLDERFGIGSAALLLSALIQATGTWVFVVVLDLSLSGAMLASILGWTASLAMAGTMLVRSGYSLAPSWRPDFLRSSLPYGAKVQGSALMMVLAGRVDLLIVFSLLGSAAAGHYSVALTLAGLVSMVPLALAQVTFPRIARSDSAGGLALVSQSCRYALATALLTAGVLGLLLPVLIPRLFGEPYRPSVGAAWLLLPAFVLASGQWILGRAAVARGEPGLLMKSYAGSVICMCAADLLLIPAFGIQGAAVGAFAGSVAGTAICLRAYLGRDPSHARFADFLPRPGDVVALVTIAVSIFSRSEMPVSTAPHGSSS
jgi:O-antigen/teichoic acid export membrane protein